MKEGYRRWLEDQKYAANTVVAQVHRAGRVEEHHGDLDAHYDRDRLAGLIDLLRYSTDDARRSRPNPSKIPFDGDVRNNLASYRSAVERYRRYRDLGGETTSAAPIGAVSSEQQLVAAVTEDLGQRIGLERDMQAALRRSIDELEPGLSIIDDGAERSVDSGFIDIMARDESGIAVVIELKAGSAGQRAIAQILSYMGDVAAEEQGGRVRGILVASDFDEKARSAARVVPTLALRTYRVRFTFTDPQSDAK